MSEGGSHSAIVHACIAAYAQTVAMCPGDHWRATEKGGRERVTTSALSRMLRRPNDYQSISDFMLNLTWELYATGNAYCLALRNDRYEVDELHLMKASISKPVMGPDGDVFYRLGGNDVISRRLSGKANSNLMVPARDCLHIQPQRGHAIALASDRRYAALRPLQRARDAGLDHEFAGEFLRESRPALCGAVDRPGLGQRPGSSPARSVG